MSFSHGFKKEAGPFTALRAAGGALAGASEKARRGISGYVGKTLREGTEAATSAKRGVLGKKQFGEAPVTAAVGREERRRAAAGMPTMSPGERGALQQQKLKELELRKGRAAKYLRGQKTPFAARHPYLTAGLAFGAGRMALGGGQQDQPAPPPVVYGGTPYGGY